MNMRVFVAGASGVLGRRVVPALVAEGHIVTANVRDAAARCRVEEAGANATTIDLFDPDATDAIGTDHDAVVNIATSIPTGVSAMRRSAWAMNNRLRSEASAHLAATMARSGGRYIGESITFPYADAGDEWIDEAHPRSYFWGNQTCLDAESAALSVGEAGGVGVGLRFAMFHADDSAHTDMIRTVARRGIFGPPGSSDGRMSWIHIDDASAAVVSALDAPSGIYNVAEPDPARRSDHAAALARVLGRHRLRSLPGPLTRLGGVAAESLARSQRISSRSLMAATGWEPRIHVVNAWAN